MSTEFDHRWIGRFLPIDQQTSAMPRQIIIHISISPADCRIKFTASAAHPRNRDQRGGISCAPA
jgi:hypothetical protein